MQRRVLHRKRFETPGQARLLTFSTFHRLPYLEPAWVRDLFVDHLALTRDRLGFQLYAWVVMPDHVHLLLLPDTTVANTSRILSALKTRTSTKIAGQLRENGEPVVRIWQRGGGHDRNITTHRQFLESVDYIEDNPVCKGMVARREDYPWSSAGSSVLGRDRW